MNSPKQLPLDRFRKELRAFLDQHGQKGTDERIRDSIVEALGQQMYGVASPIPGLRTDSEQDRFTENQSGTDHTNAALDDIEMSLDAFRKYQMENGEREYIIWSEAFYDDPQHEEEKVYVCPIVYQFQRFVESYELTGLYAAADTVVLRTDFRQLMIRFHHDCYEFYDKEFAHEFLRFCRKSGTS